MSEQSMKAKPRVGFVKSRTGCSVCKIRRIKCDETKPNCIRCTSSGRACEGYSINGKKPPPPKVSHILVPKPSPSGSFPSGEDQRQQSFQLFFDKTSVRIGRWLGTSFWKRLIFKAAQKEPSIRCLVFAIGALDVKKLPSSLANQPIQTVPNNTHDIYEYHLYGLQQYELAIKILRESTSNGQADMRITLIASILIIFFEALYGNHDSAMMQFHTGLEVIKDSSNKELHNQTDRARFPSPELVEDEIFHAYRHLYLQISFIYLFQRPLHAALITQEYFNSKLTLPPSISEPEEARLSLEYIVGGALDFITSLDSYCRTNEEKVTPGLADTWHHFSTAPLEQLPSAVFRRQEELLAEFGKWHEAFQPFFQYASTSAGKNLFPFASALQSLYLAAYLSIVSTFFKKQTEFDGFILHFNSIVNLCEGILSQPSYFDQAQNGEFSLDLYIIRPLILVGLKCRDPMLRRKAISLITSTNRTVEGLWPVRWFEKVLLWIMSVEEDGIEGNFVKEESRGWVYNVVMIGPGKRRAKVQYQLFLNGSPRGLEAESCIKETIVEW